MISKIGHIRISEVSEIVTITTDFQRYTFKIIVLLGAEYSWLNLYVNIFFSHRDGSARMSYRLLSSGLDGSLSVDRMGLVTAGPKGGHASVEVTAYENFGVNQTTVVHVKVIVVKCKKF